MSTWRLSRRDWRGLIELQRGGVTAMGVSIAAGISNFSAWLFEMRRRGLEVPCVMVSVLNRDGHKCRVGHYSLTQADRAKVDAWLKTVA